MNLINDTAFSMLAASTEQRLTKKKSWLDVFIRRTVHQNANKSFRVCVVFVHSIHLFIYVGLKIAAHTHAQGTGLAVRLACNCN